MASSALRLTWVDFVRAIAIICVILCHVTERVYRSFFNCIEPFSIQSQIFCFTCFTVGRLGVPFFLMITGYLLLQKDYSETQIKVFWKTKWLHLFICSVFWFSIYDIFLVVVKHEPLSAKTFFSDILFLHDLNMSHEWYLPMILGMYILIPFVSFTLKKFDHKLFFFPMLIYSCYLFGFPLLNAIVLCLKPETILTNQFSSGFSGGIFGLYILYGYFVSNGIFKHVKAEIIATILALSFVAAIFLQLWSFANGTVYKIWYDNLLLLITSLGLFELASRTKTIKWYRVFEVISNYAFSLYLTHNIIRSIVGDVISVLPVNKPIQVVCLWTTCIACSMLIAICISKIPKIGHYLLYMK